MLGMFWEEKSVRVMTLKLENKGVAEGCIQTTGKLQLMRSQRQAGECEMSLEEGK